MRSRPDIDVKLPKSVYPGETFHVDLVVTSRSSTPIEFISVEFHATNGTRNPLQNTTFEQRDLFHSSVDLAEAGELDEGEHRFRAEFDLPATLPPTYLGTAIEHHAWIEVRVAIPWWFDVRERFDVNVAAVPVARPKPVPVAGSSLRGNEPFVEVSLRAQNFAPGDTIEGAIAFGNVGGADLEFLEPALVGYEQFVGSGRSFGPAQVAFEAHRHTAFLPVTIAGQGREIPFRLAVPASAPTSLTLPWGKLFWMLEVRLALQGVTSVLHRIPVTIGAFEGRALLAGTEPLQIGAGRWHALWDAVGSAAGLTVNRKKLLLTGELSRCNVVVTVSKTGAKRSSLVARLRYRPWGLDVAITPAGLLHLGTFFPADELGRRFRITGRDQEQVEAALTEPLRAALLAFDEVELRDDSVEVHAHAPGYDQPWIGRFLASVTTLAEALDTASRDVPAPQGMVAFVPAWRRLAEALDADLTVGDMTISGGEFEGAVFEIRTEFVGASPEATLIELVLDPPLDAALALDLGSDEALQRAPATARQLLASINALCRVVIEADPARPRRAPLPEVREALVSLRLPVVIADPAALIQLMTSLLSLAASLRGQRRAGPYR